MLTDWMIVDGGVRATVHATKDFYRLLEWKPVPYTMTWWLDDSRHVKAVMVKGGEGKPRIVWPNSRRGRRSIIPTSCTDELHSLMPDDRIDPTGDRPERWRAMLIEWRAAAGLPPIR